MCAHRVKQESDSRGHRGPGGAGAGVGHRAPGDTEAKGVRGCLEMHLILLSTGYAPAADSRLAIGDQ